MEFMQKKKIVQYAFYIVIAMVLVYFCFKDVSWGEFWGALIQCKWWYIVLSIAIGIGSYAVRALRWKLLLDGVSFARTFNAVNIGNLSNFVIPRIGELVKCSVVSNGVDGLRYTSRNPLDKTLGTVVLERSVDVLCLLLLLAVTVLAFGGEFASFFEGDILPGIENIGPVVWLVVGLGLVFGIYFLSAPMPLPREDQKIYMFLYGIRGGIRDCFEIKGKWQFLAYTVLIWGCFFVMSLLTIKAFPALSGLGAKDALFLSLVGSLGWAVPTPGGIGSYHAVIALALSHIYGFSWETGIIFATISHESQAIGMILSGLGSYVAELLGREA